MKKDIHPQYYPKAKIQCACGAAFIVGATVPELKVEVCSQCHPFYTNKEKFVDTAGRIERFKSRSLKSEAAKATRTKKAAPKTPTGKAK